MWALVAALAGGIVAPAPAQTSRAARSLQLVSAPTVDGRNLVYHYKLIGPTRGVERYSDVFLDVRAPKSTMKGAPQGKALTLGNRGHFMFDGPAEDPALTDWSHAPLFVGSPQRWVGAVWMSGEVVWSANRTMDDRRGGGRDASARAGREVLGFELRSPALPALRHYRVVPYRSFVDVDNLPAKPDSTWVLTEGYILAPGWLASEVHWGYLYDQVSAACEAALLDRCGRYLRYVDRFRVAHLTRNDRNHAATVQAMLGELAIDRASTQTAKYVLSAALRAMASRPPSVLPPIPAGAVIPGSEPTGRASALPRR